MKYSLLLLSFIIFFRITTHDLETLNNDQLTKDPFIEKNFAQCQDALKTVNDLFEKEPKTKEDKELFRQKLNFIIIDSIKKQREFFETAQKFIAGQKKFISELQNINSIQQESIEIKDKLIKIQQARIAELKHETLKKDNIIFKNNYKK